jgi:two-component system chemotaxis sensor kinase CheA
VTPLLEQFIAESRECLQGIAEKLMQLELLPSDAELMGELFRLVHTLKGNSGLFEFPEMTGVLHAGEDLMDAVRSGDISYSQALADQLLDAMDFIGVLCDDIEATGAPRAARAAEAVRITAALRALLGAAATVASAPAPLSGGAPARAVADAPFALADVPEDARMTAYGRTALEGGLYAVTYVPHAECFFQGDDPFFTARQTPGAAWGRVLPPAAWPALADLDAYRCVLQFELLCTAPLAELQEHFRYVADQVRIEPLDPRQLAFARGDAAAEPVAPEFIAQSLAQLDAGNLAAVRQAAQTLLQFTDPDSDVASALRWALLLLGGEPGELTVVRGLYAALHTPTAAPHGAPAVSAVAVSAAAIDADTLRAILAAQRQILSFDDAPAWKAGRVQAAVAALSGCCRALGDDAALARLDAAGAQGTQVLLAWLDAQERAWLPQTPDEPDEPDMLPVHSPAHAPVHAPVPADEAVGRDGARRGDEPPAMPRHLKVDQAKIDLLMGLIGEMVVAKNALPYLAQRAEAQYGSRELAREIKAQYAVINRIAEEMQGAIMQVRMMPVSFVFQRFPRLVRDLCRKLGKEVALVLEGEDSEADKHIIESLADPLIHIVRNSLDHGFELPDARRACGKPAAGTLTIRAQQEGDQVVIEIIDDGKGIDPALVKRKAYERGLIDETTLERLADHDAIQLVFAAGFSTADVVSDVSGRGVGMDAVRTAVEKVNGSLALDSTVGQGTRVRIALPLSMAVTQVLIVESDGQIFGVPMDHVVETVRIPRDAVHAIKHSQTMVLRGSIVALKPLNTLLRLASVPQLNAYDELAVLVVRVGEQSFGLVVDDFRETVDVIQKPLAGVLAGLPAYAGAALLGDGSVLMLLNVKELL